MEPNNQHIPEQNLSSPAKIQHAAQPQPKSKPKGEVLIPALICGSVGTVLTTILSLINRYKGLESSLKEKYLAEPFLIQDSVNLHGVWNWLLVLLVCYGISFAVLDSDKIWRRVMLFFLSLVIIVMASPVLMMWEVFWSPLMVIVGLLWSWFCAFIYSVQHVMPCELLAPAKKVRQAKPPKPAKPAKEKKAKPPKTPKQKLDAKVESPVFVAPVAAQKKTTTEVSNPLKVTPKFQPKE